MLKYHTERFVMDGTQGGVVMIIGATRGFNYLLNTCASDE